MAQHEGNLMESPQIRRNSQVGLFVFFIFAPSSALRLAHLRYNKTLFLLKEFKLHGAHQNQHESTT